MPWTFFLNVTNGTDRDLVVLNSHKNWGTWYREGHDNKDPIDIPKGQTVQALGIRAARGTATGYECSCSWKDETPLGERSWGSVNLNIDVPYSKSNKSSCTVSGGLQLSNWDPLPGSGHNFSRQITITTPLAVTGEAFLAAIGEAPLDEDDKRYLEYLKAVQQKNPNLRGWSDVEKIPITGGFNAEDNLPKKLEMPWRQRFLFRSRDDDIPRDLWSGVGDPVYDNVYLQDLGVKNYFSVAVYGVDTDPRVVVKLAKGETQTMEDRVEITSFTRHVRETTWSIKTSLESKCQDSTKSISVATRLETEYGVTNVLEESTTQVTEHIDKRTFEAPSDHDIAIVPWVFSTIVLIYRVDKKDKVELIAASEWAKWQLYKTYEF